ncbi:MAG: ATP-binding cassette domain-containing protein [Chloroflexota bacterium]|nr:ATP-binding cassette domain-containing protein [Chloroflexota bacterium]
MIEAKNLTKFYGDYPAIENVSFTAQDGEVIGFLGPNGAGKTTTMRILTGFTPATSGTAIIAGYDIQSESIQARGSIGYLPETVPLYTDMTVREYLKFMGALKKMDGAKIRTRINDVVDLCRLEEYADSMIGKLSKGYRQRVGIAQAILHEPPVLVLDEPTIGIDPRQVVETRQIIKSLGGEHTVILSTHILPEVSMICDRVLIIDEGQIVAMDKTENLSSKLGDITQIIMNVQGPAEEITRVIEQVSGVKRVSHTDAGGHNQFIIECDPAEDLRTELTRLTVEHGWGLQEIRTGGLSLEDIFLRLTTSEETDELN